METEFPNLSDFSDTSAAQIPRASTPSADSSTASPAPEQVIYEQITVQPPPTVFAAYGSLADNNPLTFKEAMSCSDFKLWWEAMIDEINAVIQNKTW